MAETSFLDRTDPHSGKTVREIFTAEKERVTAILDDPAAMLDKRNQSLEWTLLAMNECLDGKAADFMMQKYLTGIVNRDKLSSGLQTAALIQKAECN